MNHEKPNDPSEIVIPASAHEAEARLAELGPLATAVEWERACIVHALAMPGSAGRPTWKKSGSFTRISFTRFAAKRIFGLSTHNSVARYWYYWQRAIDAGIATEVKLGDHVKLPQVPFSDYAPEKPSTAEAVTEAIGADPRAVATAAWAELKEQREVEAALREMGIDSSVAVSILAQLDEAGVPTTNMMRAFGKVAADAKVEHKDFNTVLTEQVKKIEDINKAQGRTAAANYATSFFGPRGSMAMLAATLDSGAISSENLTQALNGPKESIQEVMEKTAGMGEAFKLLENVASVALAPIAKILTKNISGGLDSISGWIRTHGAEIVGFFGKIADGAITAAEGIIRGFQPVLTMLGKLEYAFGDWTGNDQLMNSGQDLQDFASHMNQPGGVIDSLEKAKHKTDDWIASMQAATGVGELLDDALELPEKGQPDTGLRIKEPTKDEPHAGDEARDDLKRLNDQYGVGVTQQGDKLNVTATIKTDLKPEEQAEVDKKLKKLTDDGVHYSLDHGKLSVSADTKKAKQDVVDLINSLAGKDLKIPVTIDPHSPGGGDHHDDHPDNPHRTGTEGTRGRKRPGLTTGGWEGGFAVGGFAGDFLPGNSNTDNLVGFIPGGSAFGLAGGEGIVKTSAARQPWVKALVRGLNRGYAGGTDDAGGPGNLFGILPNLDAPAPPPGGWSTKTQQHDDAWAASIEAAKRSTEHASDRTEDLASNIAEYSSAITDLKEKMIDDDPKDLIADQKELAKTERELARAQRDYLEAVTDETDAKKKEATTRAKPPESSTAGGKDSGAEGMGQELVQGLLKGMGFPDVFGKSIFDFGIVKTGMLALGDILNLAKTKGWLGGTHGGTGPGSTLPTVTLPLPTDQQRGGITFGGSGSTAQYGTAPGGATVPIPLPSGADHLPGQPALPGPAPAGGGGGPAAGPGDPNDPNDNRPGGGGGGGGGGGQPGPARPPGPSIFLGPGGPDGGGASTYGPSPGGNTIGYTGGGGSQVQLASQIFSAVTSAGYSPAVGQAAVAAGMYESGLNPGVQNKGGSDHWGMFQEQGNYFGAHGSASDQIAWLINEMNSQGGPAAFNADPANMIASRVEKGGYGGGNYNLGAAASLLSGAASGGGGFNFPSAQSTAFTGGGGGIGGPAATDTATSGLPRYGGIPGGTGTGQPIVGWMEQQVQAYNAATGSNLSISADYPGGPHGHPDDGGDHSARRAVDISGSQDQMAAFSNYWASNQAFVAATRQLIHDSSGFDPNKNIIGGHFTSGPGTYSGGVFQQHGDHVHLAMEQIPGDIGQLVAPGAQSAPGQYPTAPQRPAAQPKQPGVTLTSQSIGGDLGLQGLDDGLYHPPQFPDYTYQHGSTGPFAMVSMIPGSDKFMHPFRGGSMGAAAGAAPPAPDAPAPASAIAATMMSRTAPDLSTVGTGQRQGERPVNISHHYEGITTPQKIAPAIMETHLAATRATVPRTFT
jgi:hypothetical protein